MSLLSLHSHHYFLSSDRPFRLAEEEEEEGEGDRIENPKPNPAPRCFSLLFFFTSTIGAPIRFENELSERNAEIHRCSTLVNAQHLEGPRVVLYVPEQTYI